MLRRARLHARRHVIAYLAVFLALSGAAYAVQANSVGPKQIKRNAVRAKHIKKGAVRTKQIKNGQVLTKDIGAGAVGVAQSQGLLEGDGQVITRSFSAPRVGFLPTPLVLAEIPGFGKIEFLYCGADPEAQIRTRLLSADGSEPFLGVGQVTMSDLPSGTGAKDDIDMAGGTFGDGGGNPLIARSQGPAGLGTVATFDWQLSRGTGDQAEGAHTVVSGINSSLLVDPPGCQVTAQTVIQR